MPPRFAPRGAAARAVARKPAAIVTSAEQIQEELAQAQAADAVVQAAIEARLGDPAAVAAAAAEAERSAERSRPGGVLYSDEGMTVSSKGKAKGKGKGKTGPAAPAPYAPAAGAMMVARAPAPADLDANCTSVTQAVRAPGAPIAIPFQKPAVATVTDLPAGAVFTVQVPQTVLEAEEPRFGGTNAWDRLPAGKIGSVRKHKSGRVTFDIGGVVYNVSPVTLEGFESQAVLYLPDCDEAIVVYPWLEGGATASVHVEDLIEKMVREESMVA